MAQPSNIREQTNITDRIVDQFRSIERRLDLVHRYKKHCDPSPKVSSEQLNFINGFMQLDKMVAFVFRCDLAIAEAIEIAEATARLARLSVLVRHVDAQY